MQINPKLEKPTRDLLGHAIRSEWDGFAEVIEDVGGKRFLECLGLCLQIAGNRHRHLWAGVADRGGTAQGRRDQCCGDAGLRPHRV